MGPVRLSIRRMAQRIQILEEEECRGEQYKRRYIVAERSVLSIAVVLGRCQLVRKL